MKLLTYSSSHIAEIKQLFTQVFSDSEGESEGLLIGNLAYELLMETDPQDLYGFIAIEDEQIVGSIVFTRLVFESGANAFLLSPVAIHTSYQGKGVGQKLIRFGINHLKDRGVGVVFTYGDPNFYSKVGFNPITEKLAKAPLKMTYPEGWLGQSLVGEAFEPIIGNSYCVEALNNPEYW
ncbi:N-acetyltransferase [Shewanella canadensis]|uniref:N-acetyltransferase n=1 Tax=Shewanella canadensis TaxID=271096 RepID=A0A431WVM5_9GAMM|nr:N-acetyltransferase [Shewanella canadensis]RTR39496.1 N-acetyltransferase [Shewanella canadensis]